MIFSVNHFKNNPVIRAEQAYIQGQRDSRWLRTIDRSLLIPALGMATIPFLTYIDSNNLNLFLLMAVTISAFCIWIEIRTLTVALNTVWREKRADTWESLILTGLDARRLVLGKWWAAVCSAWPKCIFPVLMRLVLAYGIMQYLNIYPVWLDVERNHLNRAFYYMSYPSGMSSSPSAFYPDIQKVIVGGITILVLTLGEIGWLSALGILSSLGRLKTNALMALLPLGARIAFSIAAIGFVYGTSVFDTWIYSKDEPIEWKDAYIPPWYFWQQNSSRIAETLQVSFSTLADSGSLLAANILRPIGSTLFVLRNVVSAALGLCIYTLLTWACLRMAQGLAVRQGVSPPTKQRAG